jgi:hypothetical protein
MQTYESLAPISNAVSLFNRNDNPGTANLSREIAVAAWSYNFDAEGNYVYTEDFSESDRRSFQALASFIDFLRNQYDEKRHKDAVEGIFKELGDSAESVATKVLIDGGALSNEVRSLLKKVVIEQGGFNTKIGGFIAQSYLLTPTDIREAFTSTGGMGRQTNNELALIINELRYNQRFRGDDFRLMKILLDNSLDRPKLEIIQYASGSASSEYIEHQRSPEKIIEALKEIYPADSLAITRGYDVWRGW